MVESVKVKAEGSIFSIKKGTILSDFATRLRLPHEPLFAKIDGQIVERKRGQSPFSFDIPLKKSEKWGQSPFFLRCGDSVDLRRF